MSVIPGIPCSLRGPAGTPRRLALPRSLLVSYWHVGWPQSHAFKFLDLIPQTPTRLWTPWAPWGLRLQCPRPAGPFPALTCLPPDPRNETDVPTSASWLEKRSSTHAEHQSHPSTLPAPRALPAHLTPPLPTPPQPALLAGGRLRTSPPLPLKTPAEGFPLDMTSICTTTPPVFRLFLKRDKTREKKYDSS